MTRAMVLVLPLLLALPACDNFREKVTTESWTPITTTEAPAPPFNGFETKIGTTVVTQGSGKEVAAGDLVHLRYTRTTLSADKTEHADRPDEVWVWVGREPDPEMEMWGKFGTSEVRTTLIGRKVGEVFELRVTGKYNAVTAPRYGIAGPVSPRKGHIEYIGQYGEAQPKVLAGAEFSSPSWSTITILAACPAKFSTRRGRMTQWGYVFNMFRTAWQTDRGGDLRWSAIEARCPAPDGEVRFMLGPIYWTAEPVVPGMLMAWQATYFEQRPKGKFPEDYAFVTINGRTLPTKP